MVVAPLVVLGSFGLDLPDDEPTLTSLVHPFTVIAPLLVSGSYPAVEYMAFLCVGLALGRLDLSSLRVAARIAGGGAALGLAAWLASGVLLLRLGGLAGLRDAAPAGLTAEQARNVILWDPDTTQTWWWLAERAPYTVTPLRMLHDLGVAMAVLGCCLLLARILRRPGLLWPLVAAGSMTLTLYTAHILVLASGTPGGPPRAAVPRHGSRCPVLRHHLEADEAPEARWRSGSHAPAAGPVSGWSAERPAVHDKPELSPIDRPIKTTRACLHRRTSGRHSRRMRAVFGRATCAV